MKNEIDCRGLQCPEPVLQVRKTLENEAPSTIIVLVDNDAARQNVSRFLEHQHYRVSFALDAGTYRVTGSKGEESFLQSAQAEMTGQGRQPGTKKIVVMISSAHLGHGDDSLGDMLLFNYIKTLKEMGPDLWRLIFVNSGVNFTAEGSEAVPFLQELAENGVQVLACGVCLAYFHVLDKMAVGEVSNMLEIVTSMKQADSVITI